ncbi:hypothetical protein FF38_11205 [Lucilia cuprina]|uniref:Uncharacterized protein n=1 Tax=Lucilia cuprina TaxID=7375 RepID=A0A0L0BLQ3_LUCCU|nr:hypothetical protein FF38_11205 [Lucilia cuprina]
MESFKILLTKASDFKMNRNFTTAVQETVNNKKVHNGGEIQTLETKLYLMKTNELYSIFEEYEKKKTVLHNYKNLKGILNPDFLTVFGEISLTVEQHRRVDFVVNDQHVVAVANLKDHANDKFTYSFCYAVIGIHGHCCAIGNKLSILAPFLCDIRQHRFYIYET